MKTFAIILCIFICDLVLLSNCNNFLEEKSISVTSEPSALKSYNYSTNSSICLLVQMNAHFKVKNETYNVTKDAFVDVLESSCRRLTVNFGSNSFFLVFNQTGNDYFLNEVSANLSNQTFKNDNFTWGKVVMLQSYKCDEGLVVQMGNAKFVATDVQFQAYKVKSNKFGSSKDCKDLSPVIPIVVGAVLGVLVLIVIVAYLIGRRRSRSGYEEI